VFGRKKKDNRKRKCTHCNGAGKIGVQELQDDGKWVPIEPVECLQCQGTGRC